MPIPQLTLSTAELCAALQATEGEAIPSRTVTWWAHTGIISASVQQSKGVDGNVYTLADLARARLVVQLRRSGISMQRVRVMFAFLERELRDVLKPKTTASLIVDGRRAYVVRPGEPDVEMPSGQLRLQLADAWRGTEKAARAAKRAA